MVSVLRPGQRILNIPGIGVQTSRRAVSSANPYAAYFDHLWIAKGAVDLAASYVDRVSTQTLTAGAAPTLNASGWVCAGASYLDTGIAITATSTVMVRLVTWSGFSSVAFGTVVVASGDVYWIQPQQAGGGIYWRNKSSTSETTGTVTDTIFTISGLIPYRGTTAKAALSGIAGTTNTLYICANHAAGGAGSYFIGTIAALGIKAATWNGTEQAAAHALLAAL